MGTHWSQQDKYSGEGKLMQSADFSIIRQAKVKCEGCRRNEYGACSNNPVGCQNLEPVQYDSRKEFAWYRGQQETYPMITSERRN